MTPIPFLPIPKRSIPRLSRRAFLRLALATVSASLLGGYGVWEMRQFELTRVTLRLPRLPRAFEGLTLVQLSDLHLGPFMPLENAHRALDLALAAQPDLFIFTGDFASRLYQGEAEQLSTLLQRLTAPLGTFACLGNWDWWTDVATIVRTVRLAGAQMLYNSHAVVQRGSATLYLAGVDSAQSGLPRLGRALAAIPAEGAVLLLAHEPDYAEAVLGETRVIAQFSGHTHGGQAVWPLIGPVRLPYLGHKYVRGLYALGDLQLYVNRGLGATGVPMRLNCRPEITHFTLVSA